MTAKWSRWRYLEARFVTILTIRFKGALVPAWPADRSPTRTGPVEADGAVDAQNAPTAPWKTLLVFHELPQGFPHPITHDKPRKSPESYWETRIDPEIMRSNWPSAAMTFGRSPRAWRSRTSSTIQKRTGGSSPWERRMTHRNSRWIPSSAGATRGTTGYPNAATLLILADGGGNNGHRERAWKVDLQERVCDRHHLTVRVCPPPGSALDKRSFHIS